MVDGGGGGRWWWWRREVMVAEVKGECEGEGGD